MGKNNRICNRTVPKKWFDQLQDIGCIVCYNEGHPGVPADIHHIHKNSRRVDHFHSIPLCFNHHREGSNNDRWVSRHPWKKEFEKRYGDEWELFEQVKKLVIRLQSSSSI